MPLHAKALALQCGSQPTAVLVTVDLLGLTARITGRVASLVRRRHGIRRADLLFNASHTHCGPVVDEQLSVAYDVSPQQWADIRAYTAELEGKLASVIGDAVSRLASGAARVRARRSRLCRQPARGIHSARSGRSLRARAEG